VSTLFGKDEYLYKLTSLHSWFIKNCENYYRGPKKKKKKKSILACKCFLFEFKGFTLLDQLGNHFLNNMGII